MTEKILAIDIGGSKLLTAVMTVDTADGKRIGTLSGIARRTLNRTSGKEGVWEALCGAAAETFRSAGLTAAQLDGVGATIPGLADPSKGLWVYAPFSGIRDFAIVPLLEKEFGHQAAIENDVNACAWGEKIFGVCSDIDDFLWITVSNGIGGGLVLGGKIFPGPFGGAAEIGHFNIVENGALCGCGNHGCLEAEAAGPAVARRFAEMTLNSTAEEKEQINRLKAQFGFTDEPLSAAQIARLARSGEPAAQEVFRITGHLIGRAAAFAVNLVNSERVVIGGGVAGAFDLFGPELQRTFDEQVFRGPNQSVKIVPTGLGYEAGLFAAASLLYLK